MPDLFAGSSAKLIAILQLIAKLELIESLI